MSEIPFPKSSPAEPDALGTRIIDLGPVPASAKQGYVRLLSKRGLFKRMLNRLMASIYPECEACRVQRERLAARRTRSLADG
jgi:hypothetical protein